MDKTMRIKRPKFAGWVVLGCFGMAWLFVVRSYSTLFAAQPYFKRGIRLSRTVFFIRYPTSGPSTLDPRLSRWSFLCVFRLTRRGRVVNFKAMRLGVVIECPLEKSSVAGKIYPSGRYVEVFPESARDIFLLQRLGQSRPDYRWFGRAVTPLLFPANEMESLK